MNHHWHQRGLKPKLILAFLVAACFVTYLRYGSRPYDGDVPDFAHQNLANIEIPPITDRQESNKVRTPTPFSTTSYVGSETCAGCHEVIAEQYRAHPMGRATNTVTGASIVEDYEQTEFSPPGPRHYQVEKTSTGVIHHEVMLDTVGNVIYDQAEEIQYAVGSGQHGRTYLLKRGGSFFESPITWYSQSHRWDLSPGYRPIAHERFGRQVTDNCLRCHVGQVVTDRPGSNRFPDPPFAEMAISCERCHGPGKRHVELNQIGPTGEGIVNPLTLDPLERESVCYQCHLKGTANIPRKGQSFYDFRPGQKLDDWLCVFVEKSASAESLGSSSVVSQVQQMRVSQCYLRSDGNLGCISCHDPHYQPPPDEKIQFFRNRCIRCHVNAEQSCALPENEQGEPPASGSCIHCHMPQMTPKDIVHTSRSDHRILRSPIIDIPVEPRVHGVDTVELFEGAEERLPKHELDRAYGLLYLEVASLTKDRSLLEPARLFFLPPSYDETGDLEASLDEIGNDVPVLRSLAMIYMFQNRHADSLTCWQRALQFEPDFEAVLRWTAHCHDVLGAPEKALEFQDRLLSLYPYRDTAHEHRAYYAAKVGDWESATVSAERALEINPLNRRAREWLIHAYGRLAKNEKRDANRETLRKIHKALTAGRGGGSAANTTDSREQHVN